jgi:hypothetical protein
LPGAQGSFDIRRQGLSVCKSLSERLVFGG